MTTRDKTLLELTRKIEREKQINKDLKELLEHNVSQRDREDERHIAETRELKRDNERLNRRVYELQQERDTLQEAMKGERFKIIRAMDVTEEAASAMAGSSRVSLRLLNQIDELEYELKQAKEATNPTATSWIGVRAVGGGGGGGAAGPKKAGE